MKPGQVGAWVVSATHSRVGPGIELAPHEVGRVVLVLADLNDLCAMYLSRTHGRSARRVTAAVAG